MVGALDTIGKVTREPGAEDSQVSIFNVSCNKRLTPRVKLSSSIEDVYASKEANRLNLL